ncbi:MAG TPA: hypothetical protein VED20_07305 [Streptosporangiaceae bacterium]|nr:hypothetical protein [Streptosporangiaceae bacterium]
MRVSFLFQAKERQQGEDRQHYQRGAVVLGGADQAWAADHQDADGHCGYSEATIGDGEQRRSTRPAHARRSRGTAVQRPARKLPPAPRAFSLTCRITPRAAEIVAWTF